MRRKKRTLRKAISVPEISLTPLIDTALTLLIIFMITAPMMHSVIKVDLPKASEQSDPDFSEDSLEVSIDKDGALYLNKHKVNFDQLKEILLKKLKANPKNNTIYVYGDKTLPYEKIIETFDRVSGIQGVGHVALVTQKTS